MRSRLTRWILTALTLVILALGASASGTSWAASEAPKAKAARPPLPTSLRGSLPADRPAPAKAVATRPVLAPPLPLASPAPGSPAPSSAPLASAKADQSQDLRQCRTGCDHTYYFCLSAPGANDCPTTWSQCRSSCSHPPLSIAR